MTTEFKSAKERIKDYLDERASKEIDAEESQIRV